MGSKKHSYSLFLSCQVHEFSVEPPGHLDDEYEVMEQGHASRQPDERQMHTQPTPETESHRLLSINTHSRHVKSLSLPYATSPIHGSEEFASDDDNDAGDYYSSEDEESMFVKSLPSDFFLEEVFGSEPESEKQDNYAPEVHPVRVQITEETEDQKQIDIKDSEVNKEWEAKEETKREDKDENPTHLENMGQR